MLDAAVNLVEATVQIEQSASIGHRTVGSGFLISSRDADGSPRTILITADHVFAAMKGDEAKVGFRTVGPDGRWRYAPQPLQIRGGTGEPLWTAHPVQDVAAISIQAPPEFARAAIPIDYLASDEEVARRRIALGDEMLVLGFPRGLAANRAGFPILRSGRIASYPAARTASPTFLLDFAVFPGNSGGPVFTAQSLRKASTDQAYPLITGVLTREVELDGERLGIGVVTRAKYVLETIDLLYGGRRPAMAASDFEPAPLEPDMPAARPAAATQDTGAWAPLAWVRDQMAQAWRAVGAAWWTLGRLLFGAAPGSASRPV